MSTAVAKEVVRRGCVCDSVPVEHRRRKNAARASHSPPGRIHPAQSAASAVEHTPAALGAQMSECGVDVRRCGVSVVPQCGPDEVGVLDGCHAGWYGACGRIERGRVSVSASWGRGRLDAGASEARDMGERKKSGDQVLVCGDWVGSRCCTVVVATAAGAAGDGIASERILHWMGVSCRALVKGEHGRAVEGGELAQLFVVKAAWRGPRRSMMETWYTVS